jgi:hypothetical protein
MRCGVPIAHPNLASCGDLGSNTCSRNRNHGENPRALTFNGDNQVNRVLEFHLVDPHGGVVPLSVVLAHILADAGAQLFNNV